MPDLVAVETLYDGQVRRLTLNAPKANVLDAEMMSALQAALDACRNEAGLKMIQITGAGNHFSFGASVAEHTKENAPAMLSQFHALFYTMAELAIPTAALVSGQCLGGGLEVALMCNFIFVDKSARLGQPEIILGVFAPPASLLLPLKLGQARADDLLLTGRSITGEDAKAFGLAAEVYEDREALLAGVDEWTRKHVLPKSASSLRFAVKAARMQFYEGLREKLGALERMYVSDLMETADANEGIQAFLEKRKPEWVNT
ncbi:MAG: cyclohexa-1,5-dienecarbonyl-CoA hydratase [Chlorobi bacterium]|nr:cyclohexa-1,5-dienecarbonyl-CoA hydratase [Chlorobiota bacterium]